MGALILRARRYALCRRDLSSSTTAPAEAAASEVSFKAGMFSLKPDTSFGMPAAEADARAISEARLVVVGEIHSVPPCVELQRRTAVAMMAEGRGLLHIVLEHLNFEQQPLLDAYADGTLGMAEFLEQYRQGTEGHDLVPYEPLLALGRLHRAASPEAALAAARDKEYVSDAESLDATDAHYDFFDVGRALDGKPFNSFLGSGFAIENRPTEPQDVAKMTSYLRNRRKEPFLRTVSDLHFHRCIGPEL